MLQGVSGFVYVVYAPHPAYLAEPDPKMLPISQSYVHNPVNSDLAFCFEDSIGHNYVKATFFGDFRYRYLSYSRALERKLILKDLTR